MSNTYINIVRGEDIEMSDEKFAESYTTFQQFKFDFFLDRNIEVYNEKNLNGNTTEFDFKLNDVVFHGVFLNIKNSGMGNTDRDKVSKRMQISNTFKSYDDNIPHFVIGSYNTFDKILYFVVELKEYIKNKSQGNTYSSFWLDYGNVFSTYERGFNRSVDTKNNRIIVGISNERVAELEDEELIDKVFVNNGYYNEQKNRIEIERKKRATETTDKIEIFEINNATTYNAGIKLKRNNELKKIAFERENYTCELCGTKQTFENKNGEEYFEGHHLIMYNLSSQRKYKYTLDIADNIVCLCPTCHRKVHYSDEQTIYKCISKLIEKHKNLFDVYEFDDINKILENYSRYERDDDNE